MALTTQRVTSGPNPAIAGRRSRPLVPMRAPVTSIGHAPSGSPVARAEMLNRVTPVARAGLVVQMQRTHGNEHVQRFLAQAPKPAPVRVRVQRCGGKACNCSPEERAAHAMDEVQEAVQRIASLDLAGEIQRSSSGGEALHPIARSKLEPAMGFDLGHVTIHRDRNADQLARAVDADAFTTGDHIFFREGRYDPHSTTGLRLLAHEATHTVQQARGAVSGIQHFGGIEVNAPGDVHEQEAEQAAEEAVARLSGASSSPTPAGRTGDANDRRATPARAAAGIGRTIQRAPRTDTAPGFTATWTPFASLNSPPFFFQTNFDQDGFHDEFNVPPKSSGRLILLTDVEWKSGGGGGGGGGANPPCQGPGGVPIPPEVVKACDPCPKLPDFLPAPDLQSCSRMPDLCTRRLVAEALLTKYTNDPCQMISPNAPPIVQGAKFLCSLGVNIFRFTPPGLIVFGALNTLKNVLTAIQNNPLCATCCPINPGPGPNPQPAGPTGKGRVTFESRFFVGIDGKITTTGLSPRIEANGTGAELVSPVEFIRTDIPGGVNVAFQPMIKGTTAGETHVFQHQWDIDLKQPAPPAPQPFKFGLRMSPFKTGKDTFEDEQGQQTRLFNWFKTMDPRVRDRIMSGQIQVVIAGHASHLGDPAFNLSLSEKRAKHVEQMVRGFGGAFASVNTFFFGEVLAGGGPKDNSPEFRSATTRACGQLQGADAATGPVVSPAENDESVCPAADQPVTDAGAGSEAPGTGLEF